MILIDKCDKALDHHIDEAEVADRLFPSVPTPELAEWYVDSVLDRDKRYCVDDPPQRERWIEGTARLFQGYREGNLIPIPDNTPYGDFLCQDFCPVARTRNYPKMCGHAPFFLLRDIMAELRGVLESPGGIHIKSIEESTTSQDTPFFTVRYDAFFDPEKASSLIVDPDSYRVPKDLGRSPTMADLAG